MAGILLNFDQSGAKFALPDHKWNNQPENILIVPGISAGPPPALPVGALNAADMNIANMQLNYHNAVVNRETKANLLCTKYIEILQYVKSAFLSRAFAIDQEAHAILIRNRVTNLPN